MDNKEKFNDENGVNPVKSTGGKNDVYFFNEVESPRHSDDIDLSKVDAPARDVRTASTKKKGKKGSVASTYVFFIVVIVVSMLLSIYAIFCINDVLAITKNKSTVTVNLTENVKSADDAVDILANQGLIKCKNFCKLFAKYRSAEVGGPYQAGMYYLYGKMGLEGMLQTLQGESQSTETVTLTFPEGLTVPEIVDKLVENDVCDKTSLLSVVSSTEFTYSLVSDIKSNENVPYRLEGYMFPDTYEFFVGESASSVVKKFLANGDSRITEKDRAKAKKLGYSMYEIMTIASIIQKEAGSESQMKTISSVIHNRLKDEVNFPSIGCQSTSDYITNKVGPSLSSTSAHTSDYYMAFYDTNTTSTVVGLPAGPICNPGLAAIEAALSPSDTSYYYFFHDTDGELYTAKTYTEFKEKVATYAPYLSY